ncbi:uncharacterized protein LOC113754082 [Coffea eugenioides]|uniref:uncharacterized protein LOC113754082 n=1 Tax=Coffea eugenioides TaxID=49369 RepID=UPI000F605E78|nr:uncharacterized protein LOC113754082 [Coffea eugenioides]
MGRIGATVPSFCLNRIRPLVRIRSKNHSHFSKSEEEEEEKNNSGNVEKEKSCVDVVNVKPASVIIGRKIMIVVDSSPEAKNAIQWALTHTVQSQDLVILLYVTKPSNPGEEAIKEVAPRVSQFLSCMKILCQQKRPEVQIEVAVAEGKEKGPAIVEEAKKQGVALLVLGQKKRSTTWRLLMMWAGNKVAAGGVVEYCIQNATCMALAVRKKSKKLGGYLITTKRQKDFWLLA